MPVRAGDRLDPDATRERILSTAERVFYRRGINAVGVADVADEAGASKATIYKNFGSKDGLVEATLRYRGERVRQWLEQGSADAEPGAPRVLRIFDMMTRWYAEDDFRGCALVSAAAEDRVRDGAPTSLARAHLDAYRSLFRDALAESGTADPDGLAADLVLVLEGATVVSAIDGDPAAGVRSRAIAEALLASATAET